MHPRTPLGQLLIFILSIVIINVVLALFGSPVQISIIGSLVLSAVVTLMTRAFYRD